MTAASYPRHSDEPVSKILVLDESPRHADAIKEFCESAALEARKPRPGALGSVLNSSIDLGGVLLAEGFGGSAEATWAVARIIHTQRPELPIFLRRDQRADVDDLPEELRRMFCAVFTVADMTGLRKAVDEYIFCLVYPNALVRGISEISESIFADRFSGWDVLWDTPFIVHDRVIYGEVLSLIPLESAWCRGYMMLQAKEAALLTLPQGAVATPADFRSANSLLSETTNLIWGAFKNRFIGSAITSAVHNVQVPLIVNLEHRYISFGTSNPQLCFRFTLSERGTGRTVTLLQRFVFNINWSPEDFRELSLAEAGAADSGELELF
jgi:hypothetical protein